MTTRRTIGALMIASLALFASACSSDSEGSEGSGSKSTTTVASDSAADTTTTEAPLSDEDYAASVEAISTAINGAGADLCALSTVTTEGPPTPTTEAQVESAVGLYGQLLNAVANAFPAESAAKGEALKTAATTLETDARAAGYPVDFFESESSTAALSGDGYTEAMTEYQTIYAATCQPENTAPATAPPG